MARRTGKRHRTAGSLELHPRDPTQSRMKKTLGKKEDSRSRATHYKYTVKIYALGVLGSENRPQRLQTRGKITVRDAKKTTDYWPGCRCTLLFLYTSKVPCQNSMSNTHRRSSNLSSPHRTVSTIIPPHLPLEMPDQSPQSHPSLGRWLSPAQSNTHTPIFLPQSRSYRPSTYTSKKKNDNMK